jgi:hypothetical protein
MSSESSARDARTRSAQKGAATVKRHKEEQRVERLVQMRAQIADGTLVIRQMTVAQLKAAGEAVRRKQSQHKGQRSR